MISSPERTAANRRNAQQSSGPKTVEGKAASARNAIKHGMTGDGVAVPADDASRAANLATEMREKYKPKTADGRAMIDRAALMLVRLDRMGKHEFFLVDREVRLAGESFDLARQTAAAGLFDGLKGDEASILPLFDLPEAVALIIDAWSVLALVERWSDIELDTVAKLTGGSIDESFLSLVQAQSGLDPIAESGTDPLLCRVREVIAAELTDLEAIWLEFDHKAIDRARNEAKAIALFPTTTEATHARRYEAATNRAYHQAIKAFHEAEAAGKLGATPEMVVASEPMASFCPEDASESPALVEPSEPEPTLINHAAQTHQPERSKRPDLRKLREAQRRKRR